LPHVPGLRCRAAASADQWIGEGGEFVAYVWLSQLCTLVQQRFVGGHYEQSAALLGLVERLLQEGDDIVKAAIATGFVKGF